MADKRARMGNKIRGIRRRAGLTQARLARQLGISASYLNLIENNRRPLTAPLLIKLAEQFELDLRTFSSGDDERLLAELFEVFGDPIFEAHELSNADLQELTASCPQVARALPSLYRAYRQSREAFAGLEDSLSDDDPGEALGHHQLPSEEVSDLLQRHYNYFRTLEDAGDKLRQAAGLEPEMTDVFGAMARLLSEAHSIRVELRHREAMQGAMRRYLPDQKILALSRVLLPESRNFQLAHMLALLSQREALDHVVAANPLSTSQTRDLCRVALASYVAGAVLMPYTDFYEAALAERYDIEILARRFGTSFEQVCHRLTTLQRDGQRGVPFHLVRIDIAGNISKRFTASGLHFSRFSASCPLWNVHTAFHTPGRIRVQLSQMPEGTTFLCVARTVRRSSGGYGSPYALQSIEMGCDVQHARQLVYSDGIDLEGDAAVPVGTTCRLCDRIRCEQRAFPPLHHPLSVNENVRGVSLYAPVS